MALNGSGSMSRLYSWVTDKNANVKITASRMDAEFDGIATALSTALYKDGQQVPTANLPMGGYKLTGLGDATAATDAMNRQTADARYLAIATATTDLKALLDESIHPLVNVASDTTCDIGAATSDRIAITGTTTITSLGTGTDKLRFTLFTGILTLTHNGASLILPTGANITTADGDCAVFISNAAGVWRCHHYQRYDGTPLALASNQVTTAKIADNNVTLAKLATQADGTILANVSGGAAVPTAATISSVIDKIASVNGDVLVRQSGTWGGFAKGSAYTGLSMNSAATGLAWSSPPVLEVRLGTKTTESAVLSDHTIGSPDSGAALVGVMTTSNTENYYLRGIYRNVQYFAQNTWFTVGVV